MRRSTARGTSTAVGAVLAALAIAACGPGRWWEVKPVVGPDGTNQWVVARCRFHADCIAAIGKACRHGYDVTRDDPAPKDNTMMAHCHAPQRPAPAPSASAPPPAVSNAAPVRDYPE